MTNNRTNHYLKPLGAILVAIGLTTTPVQALPDLSVHLSMKVDPEPLGKGGALQFLNKGDRVYVSGKVQNLGEDPANDFKITMSVNGKVKSFIDVRRLRSNETRPYLFIWKPVVSGTSAIRITVDPQNTVKENGGNNNSFSRTVNVDFVREVKPKRIKSTDDTTTQWPRRDTEVNSAVEEKQPQPAIHKEEIAELNYKKGISVWPKPRVNQLSTISALVINSGVRNAYGVKVELRIDGVSIGMRDLGTLPSGKIKKAFFSWRPKEQGTAKIELIIDPVNEVQETAEQNNTTQQFVKVSRR
ncbi:MAG: hypothetical protein JKX97_01250 [Candidatus Lindowbacteria bacterium]|nr:hypothetical protein [Candidatus Lindowbacteria bacterium]